MLAKQCHVSWLIVKYVGRDFWAAGRHYSICQELCAEAEAEHAGSWSIALPHCSGVLAITASAAKAKVDGLRAYQVRLSSLLCMQSRIEKPAADNVRHKIHMQA